MLDISSLHLGGVGMGLVVTLGVIMEADGHVSHGYTLINEGQDSVVLLQGYTSCHCTTIQFAQGDTLAPGDSTTVVLTFNPQGKGGDFYESGTVAYAPLDSVRKGGNYLRSRIQVAMEGTCITSDETLQRQYPISITDAIRIARKNFDFGIMSRGETRQMGVALYDTATGTKASVPVTLTITDSMPQGVNKIERKVEWGGVAIPVSIRVRVR